MSNTCQLFGLLKSRNRHLISDVAYVNKLCRVKDNLYWSDWEARSILQVDKLRATEDGYGVKNAVLHLYSPMDVQVYHELKQPPAKSEFWEFFVFFTFSCPV